MCRFVIFICKSCKLPCVDSHTVFRLTLRGVFRQISTLLSLTTALRGYNEVSSEPQHCLQWIYIDLRAAERLGRPPPGIHSHRNEVL